MSDILNAVLYQERMANQRGDLDEDRRSALDRYFGRPYGDEQEGRSQVVMRDVADTVEWIKPSLLKIFASSDEVVSFRPVSPEDEPQAEQETEYCNHILMQKNQGFLVLHDWFHDALVQRNGYVLCSAVTKKEHNKERFEGLTEDEFALLMQSEGIELVEHSQQETVVNTTKGPMPQITHDAVIKQVSEYSCVEVVNIPPERVLVASDWPGVSLAGCPFVEVIDYKSVSELRELGYEVDDNISDQHEHEADEIEMSRGVTRIDGNDVEDNDADPLTRKLKVRYVWIQHDSDNDGIAELRHLVIVGSTILEDEEDDIIPVACLTPCRIPHEHIGQSIDDLIQDLQRIRTVLTRGYLDDTYMSMHPQVYVDTNKVNIDDLLVTRVGGIRRVNGNPADAVMEAIRPSNGAATLQAIEYIDSIRENRSGVTRYNQGLDANSLNKTASGINQIMSASQQRIELIARILAETGVKALMLIIHAMSIKHGRQAEMLKLRNQWVSVDPRGWKSRRDVTIAVGIGTGSKDQQSAHLMMILQEQKQGMMVGLAKPQHLHATLKRLTQNAGYKNTDEFWADPSQEPPQPQQPPPEIQKAQMQIQADQAESQAKRQDDAQRFQAQSQLEQAKFQAEQQMQIAVDQNRQEWEARQKQMELQQTAQLEQMRAQYEDAQQARQLEFERWKVEYEGAVKLQIAGMNRMAQEVQTSGQ